MIWAVLMGFTAINAQTVYNLEQLKDSARNNNLKFQNAQLSVEAATEQRKEVFTKYFPNVSAMGMAFRTNNGMAELEIDPSGMITPEIGATLSQMLPAEALSALANPMSLELMKKGRIAGITALQPVFMGGQIVNGNRLAKVGEEVSQLQLQLSANEVDLATEQYYWQLVSLQEKQKTLDVVDSLLSVIYKDVDVAVKAGVAMRNDLLQVQLRLNDIESQRVKLNNGTAVLKLLLMQHCGLSGDDFTVENPDGLLSQNFGGDISATDSTSGDYLNTAEYHLLQKQVEACELQRKLTLGKNLPSVAVGAGLNYHNLLENDHTFGMIFATVSVPLTDWWGGSHAVKRQKIAIRKAEQQLTDNAAMLDIRVKKTAFDVQEARQQLDIALRSVEQSTENLRLNSDYYRAGTCSMSDLLQAQLLYQQSVDNVTDKYTELRTKLVEYRQARGE